MIKSYFKNIEFELIKALSSATSEIKVAVCWFTNPKLFNILLDKRKNNVSVSIIVLNDAINNRKKGLNFQKFIDLGGSFYFGSVREPMHNKYCIIDDKILVTGSYNWTYFAENKNLENISIIEDKDSVDSYLQNFTYLINEKCPLVTDVASVANTDEKNTIVEDVNLATEYDTMLIPFLKESLGKSIYQDRYTIILKKGIDLPANSQASFTTPEDNQKSAQNNIRYGEQEQGSKNTAIGSFTVHQLPELPKGEVGLDTTFEVDKDGFLTIRVLVKQTNKITEETFNIQHLIGFRKS